MKPYLASLKEEWEEKCLDLSYKLDNEITLAIDDMWKWITKALKEQRKTVIKEKPLISIYIDKNGEVDFGILGTMGTLTLEQLNQVRQMIPVAIWCAEDMFNIGDDINLDRIDTIRVLKTLGEILTSHKKEIDFSA